MVEQGWDRAALRGSASCLSHPVPLSPAQAPSPIHPGLQGFGDGKGDDGFEDRLGDDVRAPGTWEMGIWLPAGHPQVPPAIQSCPLAVGVQWVLGEGQWDTLPSPEAAVKAL